jgi:hypothetical protein
VFVKVKPSKAERPEPKASTWITIS